MKWEVSTGPVREPISLQEAKDHLRVTTDADDEYISTCVKAARQWCEQYQRRAYLTQTQKLYLDYGFPKVITLPNPPLATVSSISYTDTDGNAQTLSSSYYTVDTVSEPGIVYETWGYFWPACRPIRKAITVTYTCGYSTNPVSVPEDIRQAIKLIVAQLYEVRNPTLDLTIKEVPMTAKWLLDSRRLNIL